MSGGILQDITKGASILGMFIIGVLVKQWVNIGFKIALPSTTLTDPKAYVDSNGPTVTGEKLVEILDRAPGVNLGPVKQEHPEGQPRFFNTSC